MLFSHRRFMILLTLLLVTLFALAGAVLAGPREPDIVGGQEADPGEYPWQVALVRSGQSLLSQYCGGSLIHREWVVTAAHCVEDETADEVDVAAGVHDLGVPDPGFVRSAVTEIVIHPGWNPSTSDNDIALLRLATPIDERPGAGATLPIAHLDRVASDAGPLDGVMATVTGWGNTLPNPPGGVNYPDQLQEVSLPIITNAACNAAYGGGITANMLCAAAPGKDACQGDSGGPLIVFDNGQARWELAGVVSFGEGCAHPNFPGVYARVSQYNVWIDSYVLALSHHVYLPAVFDIAAIPLFVNGHFEYGPGVGWLESSTHDFSLVTNDFTGFDGGGNPITIITPHGGTWAAWLGGGGDETSVLSQQVAVHPGAPFLTFYSASGSQEPACGNDRAGVDVNGVTVQGYDLCEATENSAWTLQSLNLAAYAGQSIALAFWVETNADLNSNWFIDDVLFAVSGTAAAPQGSAPAGPDVSAPRGR